MFLGLMSLGREQRVLFLLAVPSSSIDALDVCSVGQMLKVVGLSCLQLGLSVCCWCLTDIVGDVICRGGQGKYNLVWPCEVRAVVSVTGGDMLGEEAPRLCILDARAGEATIN